MFHSKRKTVSKDVFEDYETLKREVNQRVSKALCQNPYELVQTGKLLEGDMKFRRDLRKAIREGAVGNRNAKLFVVDLIKEILVSKLKASEEQLEQVVPFGNVYLLSVMDKFAIMLYRYEKLYAGKAFLNLVQKYQLAEPKLDRCKERYYEISETDIQEVFQEEGVYPLTYVDKLNIIAQKIYEDTRGNGPVDRLFYLVLDGISGGVSGSPIMDSDLFFQDNYHQEERKSYQSIWVFFQGKTIHLSFLQFSSQKEFVRICKNIYRFQNPGQLSQKKGYIVNEMADGSRVAVARPPFSESWVFFIRKFNSVGHKKLDVLLTDANKKLPIQFMKWAIRGCQNIAITGEQGSGKTTLLMSMVSFIHASFNLRVQELAFELHLRKLYPNRNIVSFRETNTITGQEGLDFQKKTDGAVNILGEVATNEVCSWLIQMAQVASNFTLFTHHAKTTKDLLYAFRNALLLKGGFSEERIALEQVVHVIHFDIHMKKAEDGHRYIERITEIIETESEGEKGNSGTFKTRDLIQYVNGEYRIVCNLSEQTQIRILTNLDKEDRKKFLCFLQDWEERRDE